MAVRQRRSISAGCALREWLWLSMLRRWRWAAARRVDTGYGWRGGPPKVWQGVPTALLPEDTGRVVGRYGQAPGGGARLHATEEEATVPLWCATGTVTEPQSEVLTTLWRATLGGGWALMLAGQGEVRGIDCGGTGSLLGAMREARARWRAGGGRRRLSWLRRWEADEGREAGPGG